MAGMSETCNHVMSLFFRVEAAATSGLTNTLCTAKSCEWLPNRKDVKPIKLKDISLKHDDFDKQGKKSRRLVPSPKKNSYCYHLIYKDNEFYLNRNPKYFTQCQMQLGVTVLV